MFYITNFYIYIFFFEKQPDVPKKDFPPAFVKKSNERNSNSNKCTVKVNVREF